MPTSNGQEPFVHRVLRIVSKVWSKYVTQPRRTRDIEKLTEVFIHKTEDGLYFNIDPAQYIDRAIFVDGIYEGRFLAFVKALLPKDGVLLDVGANIGNHAIYLSRSLSEIHCFEPNPETFRRLTDNIALNRISNIRTHQVGIGDEDATLSFQINLDGNLGASGYVDYAEKRHQKTEIIQLPILNGDGCVNGLGLDRIDFVKVDVEGLEPRVFNGLRSTIARYRPMVGFEFHGQHAQAGDFDSIRSALPGYQFFELRFAPDVSSVFKKLRWWLRNSGHPEITPIGEPERRTYENIIAVPAELSSRLVGSEAALRPGA